MEIPDKFKRYKNIEKLMGSLLNIPATEVGEFNVGYDGGEISNKEFIQSIKKQKIWGFVDDKGVIHYWMDDKAPIKTIISFIAHETGHMNGKKYKDQNKEENKAHLFEQVACYAYEKALKMRV
jgi:hypothetical protein